MLGAVGEGFKGCNEWYGEMRADMRARGYKLRFDKFGQAWSFYDVGCREQHATAFKRFRVYSVYNGKYEYILAMEYMALCGHLETHDGKHDRIDCNLPKTTACCVAFASNLVLATPTLMLA